MPVSSNFLNSILKRKKEGHAGDELASRLTNEKKSKSSFASHPALKQLRLLEAAARTFQLPNPFFRMHENSGGAHTLIDGKDYINFSHYNYLGLNGHPAVNEAAIMAVKRYGTSSGASRLVAGERPPQQALEKALADLYGVDAAIVFVSGHATNVSSISTLFGPGDLIIHDSLAHNSIVEGIRASGAVRRSFAHNNLDELTNLLKELRSSYSQALLVVEGLYSMDGDYPDLPRLIELKKRFNTFLMVDEAHSLGVLGNLGKGIAEHSGVPTAEVDIWMGTLSKTLASCGGFIAGSRDLVDLLKSSAPGFVYSVGISPPLASASLKALELMENEPERIETLRRNSSLFLHLAKEAGLDTGTARGYGIIPVIVGSSRKALSLSGELFDEGINVQPIIHPAVEEKASRLRFFLSASHTEEDIRKTMEIVKKVFAKEGLLP